eukprot:CAMPEP_0202760026 /NCGR_PEP_ID=MMETSP1388-20130828/18096_1 /ASSEMBLY_ACC=CAM_ASM_000864 /TAXON_ID=37098 /ORGANISM="Isochrysis sp, Strain CCMP1244" /LENGTH=66 /DNA_ID=CAMNT_0049428039 /DNA_START=85 /DNA_END=286 /DNA_ORIENTATION=+
MTPSPTVMSVAALHRSLLDAVDRGTDAAAAPSRAARDGAASVVAGAHARDPRRSARTRPPGFEPAA